MMMLYRMTLCRHGEIVLGVTFNSIDLAKRTALEHFENEIDIHYPEAARSAARHDGLTALHRFRRNDPPLVVAVKNSTLRLERI